MKVTLLNIQKAGDNKDFNAGFGTTFQAGNSIFSKLLQKVRLKGEYFPLVAYGYLSAILKQNGHEVNFVENSIPENSDLVILYGSIIRYEEEIAALKQIKAQTRSKIGIVGPFASVKPEIFQEYSDFIVLGEPEEAIYNINDNYIPKGLVIIGTPFL